jgi:hypothetical protein
MSNNHDLLLQASIIRQPSFGRHDNDDLGAELASSSTMIMFQSALRPIASLLLATLFLQSFSYGSEGSATGEAYGKALQLQRTPRSNISLRWP